MEDEKRDILKLMLSPYALKILELVATPKRFNELRETIKNARTLSAKLSHLRKYGLIKTAGMVVKDKYHNSYVISQKGKDVLRMIRKL